MRTLYDVSADSETPTILAGDRDERYELPILSRRPVYVRPAYHIDEVTMYVLDILTFPHLHGG
jgi:hypothetical protein